MALTRFGVRLAAALALILAVPVPGGGPVTVSASSDASCSPRPGAIQVPSGWRASGFALEALVGGRPCAGEDRGSLSGFSIRQGGRTLYLHIQDAGGGVSEDPVPLQKLVLGPGEYTLHAAPAAGASVRLRFALRAEGS